MKMLGKHAEQAKEYAKFYREQLLCDVAPYWVNSEMLDKEYGGCITSMDREGKSYNNDKSVWFQGRCLWTFSALCRKYGVKEEWKEIADSAKKFMEEKCFDTDGRMYFTVTREGKPLRKRRYMFSESFYVMSMAEYGATFGDADAIKKAEDCYEMMLSIYEDGANDPFKITPKVYVENRDERAASVPMVLLSTAQVLRRCDPAKAEYYTGVVAKVVGDLLKFHHHPELKASLETVYQDGSHEDNPAGRCINPGHSCENSWFIMSNAVYTEDKELLKTALEIFDFAFERGWDKEHGGVLYYVDLDGRPCEQLEWDMKLWWVHNEVLIASLYAYALTGEEKYWERFEMVHEYAFSHFSDKECGEWYGYLHRDGTVSHIQKGSMWKGPFHLPRCLMLCEEILNKIASGEEVTSIL